MRNISSAFSKLLCRNDVRHNKFGDSRAFLPQHVSRLTAAIFSFSTEARLEALQHAFAARDALHIAGRGDSHGDSASKSLED